MIANLKLIAKDKPREKFSSIVFRVPGDCKVDKYPTRNTKINSTMRIG